MKLQLRFLLHLLLAVQTFSQDLSGFSPLCGDCWCTIDDGSETCPPLGETVRYNVDQDWDVFYSFRLKSPTIQLAAPDGSTGTEECSPFNDLGKDMPDFEQGQLPQCVLDPPQSGNYCGYKYPNAGNDDEFCEGREYEMASYETLQDLEADGAQLIHHGACGVCSNAQDVWTKMDTLDNIATRSVVCAVTYLMSRDFNALLDCVSDLGWSKPCALQWAHYTIATTLLCSNECMPDSSNNVEGNGPPPACEYSSCFVCSWEKYPLDKANYDLAGYSGPRGGVVDRGASHKCSVYQPVVYDPCVGAKAGSGGRGGNLEDQQSTDTGSGQERTMATSLFNANFLMAYLLVAALVFAI